MEETFKRHVDSELAGDVDVIMSTMSQSHPLSVCHAPSGIGAIGREGVERFYQDTNGVLFPSKQLATGDMKMTTISKTVGARQLVSAANVLACSAPILLALEELTGNGMDEVLEFAAQIFFHDEPLQAYDPLHTLQQSKNYFQRIRKHLIGFGSVVAKDSTGHIVGCRLCIDETVSAKIDYTLTLSPQVLEIWAAVRQPFRNQVPDITVGSCAHFVGLCVAPEARNRGLGKRLCTTSEIFLKQRGFSRVVVECSSAFSLALVKSVGYKEILKLKYSEFKFKDGLCKYSNMPKPHEAIVLLTKLL